MRSILSWIFNGSPADYRYLIVRIEEEMEAVGEHAKVHTRVSMRGSASLTLKDQLTMIREAADELERRIEAGAQ